MSTPVLPTVIRGPAIIQFGSYSFYTAGDIRRRYVRTTNPTAADFYGRVDETLASGMVDLEFTPAGEIESLIKYFPFGPSNLVATSSIGNSILTGVCTIHTKAGQTIAFNRAGISKSPTLTLGPRAMPYGSMTISAIGKAATQPTDAAFWKTIASLAFSDTGFDPSLIVKDIYSAELGSRSAPFDAMGARNGFEFEVAYELENAEDDNVGVADRILTGMTATCRFAPNNLTEAQVDELASLQGADAILPGQSISRGPSGTAEDLTIASDVLTAILHNAGVRSVEGGYGVKVDRNGNIEFAARMTFTAGAPNPLFSLTVN
jgi:hypothetical protein